MTSLIWLVEVEKFAKSSGIDISISTLIFVEIPTPFVFLFVFAFESESLPIGLIIIHAWDGFTKSSILDIKTDILSTGIRYIIEI